MTNIVTMRERYRSAIVDLKILRNFRARAELRDEQHRQLRDEAKIMRERIKMLEKLTSISGTAPTSKLY